MLLLAHCTSLVAFSLAHALFLGLRLGLLMGCCLLLPLLDLDRDVVDEVVVSLDLSILERPLLARFSRRWDA